METVLAFVFEVIITWAFLLVFYAIFASLFVKDKKSNNKSEWNISNKEKNIENDSNQYKFPWEINDDLTVKSKNKHQDWLIKNWISGWWEKYTNKKSRYTHCWHCTRQINNTSWAECTVCWWIICPYCWACLCWFYWFH